MIGMKAIDFPFRFITRRDFPPKFTEEENVISGDLRAASMFIWSIHRDPARLRRRGLWPPFPWKFIRWF